MKKYRIICNLSIAFFAVIGVILSYNEPNAVKNIILYFTTQSNIWIMLIALVMVFYDLAKKAVPKAVYIIKYIFTVSIMVTGIVYNLILAPQYAIYFGSFFKAYSMSVTLLHVVVPLLAFISYILFDENPFKRKFNLLGYTMPMLYFLFIIVLSIVSTNDYIFDGMDGSPSRFPYFFLDYINNGWFTLTGNIAKLGVFYWFLISLVLVIVIGQLLRFTQRKIFQSKFYTIYISSEKVKEVKKYSG